MTITGQPKSNSEYIQSSGRVGGNKEKPKAWLSPYFVPHTQEISHYREPQIIVKSIDMWIEPLQPLSH